MEDAPTGQSFIEFMTKFQNVIEKTVKSVEDKMEKSVKNVEKNMETTVKKMVNEINVNLEAKLENIDNGLSTLKMQSKENEKKSEQMNNRIKKMEEDIRRLNHRRMHSSTLIPSENQPTRRPNTEDLPPPTQDFTPPQIEKCKSWSQEVDEETEKKSKNNTHCQRQQSDRQQWTELKRNPPHWTDDLQATVRPHNTTQDNYPPHQPKETYHCEKTHFQDQNPTSRNPQNIKHWFGFDQDISTDEDTDDDLDNTWNTVDRQKKSEEKKRKIREKRKKTHRRNNHQSSTYHRFRPHRKNHMEQIHGKGK